MTQSKRTEDKALSMDEVHSGLVEAVGICVDKAGFCLKYTPVPS
ncbi:MAG: hypothetical protein RML95_03510 [Anaerolineae bacterium]|nr:hypothetical protein [Anaerolineae bacterium]